MMDDVQSAARYRGWSKAEIAADQALAVSTRALRRADGLLNPALDPIFERAWRKRDKDPPKVKAQASAARTKGGLIVDT